VRDERFAVAGAILAIVAGVVCCALPLIVTSGALATVGTWLVNPLAGAVVGIAVIVILAASLQARRSCQWSDEHGEINDTTRGRR